MVSTSKHRTTVCRAEAELKQETLHRTEAETERGAAMIRLKSRLLPEGSQDETVFTTRDNFPNQNAGCSNGFHL